MATSPSATLSLEDQIRQQWGKYGEWDAAGVDRVAELAGLLRANGIEDLSQLSYKDEKFESAPGRYETVDRYETVGTGDSQYDKLVQDQVWRDPTVLDRRDFYYGDRKLGFLGDVNRGGSYSKVGGDAQGDLGAWSAEGKGNVGYNWQIGPDGKPYLAPVWASSSDMHHVRNIAKLAGAMALAGGAATALGAGAAGGGAAAEGATAGILNPEVYGLAAQTGLEAGATTAAGTAAGTAASLTPEQVAFLTANGVSDAEIATIAANVASGDAALVGGSAAATSAAGNTGLTTAQRAVLNGAEGYGPGMSGTQTTVFDTVLNATGSTELANAATELFSGGSAVLDFLKPLFDTATSGGYSNTFLRDLMTLFGGGMQQYNLEKMAEDQRNWLSDEKQKERDWQDKTAVDKRRRQMPVGILAGNVREIPGSKP